ncbi:MAG: hypothetical protein AB9882_11215 [Ignavibacteriaceae bacterium]
MGCFRKKIGGEFAINPESLKGFDKYKLYQRKRFFSSGRSALMIILANLRNSTKLTIHVPYYICQSVIDAIFSQNIEIRFYNLDDNYRFPIEHLVSVGSSEIILLVDYFGFVNNNEVIKKIKQQRKDVTVIEDKVQSFWTYKETNADYSFTSLRKHFEVPDGAFVYSKTKTLNKCIEIKPTVYAYPKLIGGILKYYGFPDELYLKFFKDGEILLNKEIYPSEGTSISRFLWDNFDSELIRAKRIQNSKLVYEIGDKYGLEFMFSYTEGIIPLCVPILIKNRDRIRKKLNSQNIFLPVHWTRNTTTRYSEQAKYLSENELSIIIDQRFNSNDIEYIVFNLLRARDNE